MYRIEQFGSELGLTLRFFQTNHEGEFVEHLHGLTGLSDGVLLNPGAWTHYAYSIRDALELTGLPAVEVHLSDVDAREEWRRHSVIRDLCIGTVKGQGVDGYREALAMLKGALRDVSVPPERVERLAEKVAERELDALLVTDLVNVRYLTGFTGSNGIAVVVPGRSRVAS